MKIKLLSSVAFLKYVSIYLHAVWDGVEYKMTATPATELVY